MTTEKFCVVPVEVNETEAEALPTTTVTKQDLPEGSTPEELKAAV
jgi:hypothetical protein